MITIPLQVPEDLAERLKPLQNQLVEIIELGLRQMEKPDTEAKADQEAKSRLLKVLLSTGIVTPPDPSTPPTYVRHTPIQAGGKPVSEIIIEQRGPR